MSSWSRAGGMPPASDIALPVTSRAPDGRRLGLVLGEREATLTLTDDLAALEEALVRRGGFPAGPFPREAVLALLADLLGGTDG